MYAVEIHVTEKGQWFRCPECNRKIRFTNAFVGFIFRTCPGCRVVWSERGRHSLQFAHDVIPSTHVRQIYSFKQMMDLLAETHI